MNKHFTCYEFLLKCVNSFYFLFPYGEFCKPLLPGSVLLPWKYVFVKKIELRRCGIMQRASRWLISPGPLWALNWKALSPINNKEKAKKKKGIPVYASAVLRIRGMVELIKSRDVYFLWHGSGQVSSHPMILSNAARRVQHSCSFRMNAKSAVSVLSFVTSFMCVEIVATPLCLVDHDTWHMYGLRQLKGLWNNLLFRRFDFVPVGDRQPKN